VGDHLSAGATTGSRSEGGFAKHHPHKLGSIQTLPGAFTAIGAMPAKHFVI
jgi:hypothetical protein